MRSIRNLEKFDILKQNIDEMQGMDIVTVSETWLNSDHFEFYNISGLKGFFSGRNIGDVGGGLTVYVREGINVELITMFDESFNSVWVKILTDVGPIYIAGYYRPDWSNFSEFSLHLENFLANYNCFHCIILGDMNINVLDPKNFEYKNLIESYRFLISNGIRTRPASDTLLDHFITNFAHKFKIMNHTIDNDFNDHSLILSEVFITCDEPSKSPLLSKFIDLEKFKSNLNDFLLEETYVPNDVDSICEFLINAFTASEIASTTCKEINRRKKEILCPWMTRK